VLSPSPYFDAFFKKTTTENGMAVTDASVHAFVASLFAGALAVKAAYAQHPHDAEAIQAADAGLVAKLNTLPDIKRRDARDPAATCRSVAVLAEEQRHLLRTYEVTARKLEAELRACDVEAGRARVALEEAEEGSAGKRVYAAVARGVEGRSRRRPVSGQAGGSAEVSQKLNYARERIGPDFLRPQICHPISRP
jgi:hypothetical protein